MLPVTQIGTFYNGLTLRHRDTINVAAGGIFMKRLPEECYDLIENMTAHHNDWDTSAQRGESSSSIISSSDTKIAALKPKMAKINKNLMRVLQVNQQVKAVTPSCETCGGPHCFFNCPATVGNTQNIPRPQVVTTNEFINFMKANDAILKNMQTNMTSLTKLNLELKNMFGQFMKMNTASSSGSGTLPSNMITNPKEDLKGITTIRGTAYPGPMIPTTSSFSPVVERETEVTKGTVNPTSNESTEDAQPPVVQSESPILTSEPVNSPIIKPVASLINALKPNLRPSIPYPSRMQDQKLHDKANDQREKFFQIFKYLNFNISFVDALILMPKFGPSIKSLLTKKDKLSLADLAASINLMPLSMWNKLSLPDLSSMCMTLELVDHSISCLVGVAEDVFVKVGTFHFPADFVVVDFDVDPRVPLILGRSFLKTERALIDVFEGELTLHVGKEAITFNLDQTSRYSANYNETTANRIDVIDMACEEYSQEVLGFQCDRENNDFLLEEVDAFLVLEDDPTSPKVDQSYLDTKGDILFLEAFLNDDPSLPPPNQGNYLPEVRKEHKICDDKLQVFIAKDLSVEEKISLITVLKSYKRSVAWKLSDIKGIDPEFCTHKILMEEDFKPTIQHQRRVNPKIHNVIKQEVLKLLDARLIYSIFDSPWVSPEHCVPKKGGFTVVKNEENELILTRLVTGWRVCIYYRKLNEATRKDHFPLLFMDQMLERLAGNQYYCFLDGFFGLCNAPGMFQRCMMAIFHDMMEKTIEVFMDDFSVFRNSFQSYLSHVEKMLKRCEDTNLCLNWEKSQFMVKEGIILDHKISKEGIEVDKAKVDVITKLPHPTT
nr:reverse transcriptase domain-containing protein [Tanacetum cinerariifolium]